MREIEDDYEVFVEFLARNEPVIVKSITKNWKLQASSLLQPNEALLRTKVPVDIVGNDKRVTMEFGDFLDLASKENILYCKDWHVDRCSELRGLYDVPACFQDDWLNWYWHSVVPQEYPAEDKDDYSFCYVGTTGSSTDFHHDVCYSYSWSVNLLGIKKWRLYPDEGLKDTSDECIEILQHPGDAIFIPSGCYHEVDNVCGGTEESHKGTPDLIISINRNWLNGFNIHRVFRFIMTEYEKVRAELLDLYHQEPSSIAERSCGESMSIPGVFSDAPPLPMSPKEWHCHCDVILLANAAMNWRSFLCLITARILLMVYMAPKQVEEMNERLQQSVNAAAKVFCPRYKPALDFRENYEQLFQLQRIVHVVGLDGTTVWNHSLSELRFVILALKGDEQLLTALSYIYEHTEHDLQASLEELISVCKCISIMQQ